MLDPLIEFNFMSTYKKKYFKNTKDNNTIWLDKLINQLEKSKGGAFMNTFRNKQFKNELDPKFAFYDCLRSCELKSSSEKTLEECIEFCDCTSSSENLGTQK